MKLGAFALAATAAVLVTGAPVQAQTVLTSTNGQVRIGINQGGQLITGGVGLGFNFTGQGGLSGFRDGLAPGCACEAWGVAANGIQGQIGQTTGTNNISLVSANLAGGTYTSVTTLSSLSGLSITQAYSLSNETSTGALFVNRVTLRNNTDVAMTDLRYARSMDWDVPPTEFDEHSTIVGTRTTANLLRSTTDGFAAALPISGMTNGGRVGTPNTDGTFGPGDIGSFFIFGFGDLAARSERTFNIYYGAGANQADALALLGGVNTELYNLGQSDLAGRPAAGNPTFVFGFSGVGGTVVVPPAAVPEPATWAMMIAGFGLVGAASRRKRTATSLA